MKYLNVGALRQAIADVPDEMEVLMRISDGESGGNYMASVVSAIPDPGCGEIEVLILDGCENDADED